MNIALSQKHRVIRTAVSESQDPKLAVQELALKLADSQSACVVFFCSVHYDLKQLSSELEKAFAGFRLVGCTTAGEITPLGYKSHTITAFSLPQDHFAVETQLIKNLASFSSSQASVLMKGMMGNIMDRVVAPFNTHSFAISLLDGLSIQQEKVLQALSTALNDIPLLGGSAGDDLLFKDTHVYYEGAFYSNAAVLILVNTDFPFEVMSAHHLTPLQEKMVVTKADPYTRKVQELNAEPAAPEYCRITGLSLEELESKDFALNPLAVQFGEDLYIRAIQKINEDMSLTFFCAVDVGVVLTQMKSSGIVGHANYMFSDLVDKVGNVQLTIAYDCIHRRMEIEHRDQTDEMSRIYQLYNMIGFNTYGEQLDAKHINHTLTCVVIGDGENGQS